MKAKYDCCGVSYPPQSEGVDLFPICALFRCRTSGQIKRVMPAKMTGEHRQSVVAYFHRVYGLSGVNP